MKSIFLAFITLFSLYASGQVTTNTYTTEAARSQNPFPFKTVINQYKITAPDIASLKRIEQEEEERDGNKGFKFAHAIEVNINPLKYGQWSTIGEYAYWSIKFSAAGATCLSVNFSKFNLPPNTDMFISNGDRTMITGPITSNENNAAEVWGSSVYKGRELLVEIKVPAKDRDRLMLETKSIAYGYKEVFSEKEFGESGTCNINVLCPLGTGWEAERNTVSVLLNASSTRFCSGALVANTCGSNIPYYLTANHCFSDGDFANWKFLFRYWSPQCTPNQNGSTSLLFNGAQLRANNAASDFRLLQLNQTPSFRSGIHYAGWSRNTASITSTTGIHHPRGDVMKISQVNATPAKSVYLGGAGSDHWEMNWLSTANGVTEGGSSGSPLFDQNHRIIGQLHGGWSSCTSSDLRDWYGAFDVSWTGGGTNATRLSNWLDPSNSGAMTTNTTNVLELFNPNVVLSISGLSSFCSGSATYLLSGAPPGVNVNWSISDPSIASLSANGNQATVTRIGNGSVILSATLAANNCNYTSNTATQTIYDGTVSPLDIDIYLTNGDPDNLNCFSIFTAKANFPANAGVTGYQWTINPEWTIISSPTNSSVNFGPNVSTQNGWIALSLENACGWGGSQALFMRLNCDIGMGLRVSPNPASNYLYVTLDKENTELKTLNINETIHFKLYNFYTNQVVKQWQFSHARDQHTLNLAGVKKGNYILVVTKGKYRQTKQVMIK